jgi:cardiolipin synthase (CMP-forming)
VSSSIITLPNLITLFRMALIPVFISLVFYGKFFLSLVTFMLAGLSDGIDGYLARNLNQKSQLGTILDPIADKLLLVTAFVVLSLPSIAPQPAPRHFPVPFWVTVAVISRDVFIVAGVAAINLVTGFRRFRPSLLGKINTCVQILSVVYILLALSVPPLTGYLPTVYTIIFTFTVVSGVHYIWFASRLMNQERKLTEEG